MVVLFQIAPNMPASLDLLCKTELFIRHKHDEGYLRHLSSQLVSSYDFSTQKLNLKLVLSLF